MTVGIAAISEADNESPKVVISADRMLTTRQQSAIEHEHPGTKLAPIAENLPNAEVLSVFAGSVSLAEALKDNIQRQLCAVEEQNDPMLIDVRTVAKIAASEYRHLVQEKIENIVLSTYGLELEDLSKQHQFKDSFFNDVWAQANQLDKQIQQNLVLLIGGVDQKGAHIFEIGNNDVTGHNDIGHATIGSGTQPAESEFIKSGYGKEEDFQNALATVTAANSQAKKARGVGNEMDIGVVTPHGTDFVDSETIKALIERQDDIADEQQQVKDRILNENTIKWRPNQ